ncbi:MAG: hypothetical protein AAB873_00230, partial [Patescibacteria group bacterium]
MGILGNDKLTLFRGSKDSRKFLTANSKEQVMDNLFTLIGTLAAILGVIIILRSIADGSGDLMWVAWICAVVVLFSYAVVNHPGTLVWSFVDHAENDKI